MGPSSCVLCLEIQYFSLWGALALGSWDDTKATPTKEDGNKPTWPTSASHGTGLVLWTSKYWVKPDNGWSKELQTTCVWFKILQWKRLAIAFLGNTLTHHKAFIVHFQCPFFFETWETLPIQHHVAIQHQLFTRELASWSPCSRMYTSIKQQKPWRNVSSDVNESVKNEWICTSNWFLISLEDSMPRRKQYDFAQY